MSNQQPISPRERRLAIVRIVLGTGQIMGATVALILLVRTGVSTLSTIAVAITGLMTVSSLILFPKGK
ncbi:MAG TPA: hypothetical protein VMM56_11910 [Planctomycetaceae bacterium]|nr:hypothetical protein [Planctomycetaceae bacterium]